jgi:hypothetical protein
MQPVYLVSIKNLKKFLEALRRAQAPEKLGVRFVEELGFTSTNDRLFIPLLRAMRFVDESGKPTSRYHAFLDDTQWQLVLAEGIKDAYPDLFRVNRDASTLSREQLTGKMKSLTEGKVSAAVLGNMTKTFLELVKLADFSSVVHEHPPAAEARTDEKPVEAKPLEGSAPRVENASLSKAGATDAPNLVYRIEIVLPAVRDQAVYDAIFRSAKEHLLR